MALSVCRGRVMEILCHSLMEAAWDVYLALLNEVAAFKNRLNSSRHTCCVQVLVWVFGDCNAVKMPSLNQPQAAVVRTRPLVQPKLWRWRIQTWRDDLSKNVLSCNLVMKPQKDVYKPHAEQPTLIWESLHKDFLYTICTETQALLISAKTS